VVHRIPEDGFRDLEEAYVQEVLDSHAADLTEEGFEQLTVLGEPADEEYSSVMKKRPQMAVYLRSIVECTGVSDFIVR